MKYIITLSVIILNYGCDNAYPKEQNPKETIIHDTIMVSNSQVFDYCLSEYLNSRSKMIYWMGKKEFDSAMYYVGKMATCIQIEEYVKGKK